MSHHLSIYNKAGIRIGHLRITNDAVVLDVYLNKEAVANPGVFLPLVKVIE